MTVKRTFILGDKWLYYKIYCGARTADSVLTETIKPLTEHLLKEKYITQWFFIRYNDPDFHLRIRFYLKDTAHIGNVIPEIHKALQHYVEDDVVHNVQADTYQREIERYGAGTMVLSETLFYHESTMLLEAINAITDEKLYFLFILKAIDRLLSDFKYNIDEKLNIATANNNAYRNEFHADRRLNKQLDKKYRNLKEELSGFLNISSTNKEYAFLEELIEDKTQKTAAVIQSILNYQKDKLLEMPLNSLISSYIHMLVNRAFRSRQRFYELVCYDFLKRYYATLKMNNK